jgi:anti-anti-sigma regulatory factor
MSELSFLSSAGLIALHTMVQLLRSAPSPDPESGWQAFHALGHDRDRGLQPHVKLLSPRPKIRELLQMVGIDTFFEIYNDLEIAVASF